MKALNKKVLRLEKLDAVVTFIFSIFVIFVVPSSIFFYTFKFVDYYPVSVVAFILLLFVYYKMPYFLIKKKLTPFLESPILKRKIVKGGEDTLLTFLFGSIFIVILFSLGSIYFFFIKG